ncbi:MAG: hypothetical protein JXQ27_16405 [Acidobacteria bacterium]|nr:hypothetical protein [Acidobacteriota bacterium]
MSNQDVIGMIGGLAGAVISLVIFLGIMITIIMIVQSVYKRIPPEHREMEPGMVWLLLIPCFNVVWNFFVFPKLSRSLKSYFFSIGRTDVGDCGEGLGLAYAILSAVSIIPYLNCLTFPAAIIILIIFLVKATGLKNQI